MSERKPLFQTPRRIFWQVLAVAVLARFFCAAIGIEITADSVSYQISAMGLLNELFPGFTLSNSSAYPVYVAPAIIHHNASDFLIERTPGFPLLMMIVLGIQGWIQEGATTDGFYRAMVLSNSLMGIGIALLSSELGWRISQHRGIALAAGLLAALSPALIGTEHVVLSEPLYTLSLLMTLLLGCQWIQSGNSPLPQRHLLLLGLLNGWLIWIKPVALAVPVAMSAFLWLHRRQRALSLFWAPILLMMASWMVFQASVHGGFIGYTAGGGMNQLYKVVNFMDLDSPLHADFKAELQRFAETVPPENAYMGVNAVHTQHIKAEAAQPEPARRAMWEVYRADDIRARAIAQEAIAAHPARYLQVTLQQIPRTWLDPTVWDKHLIVWSPVFLLGLLGMVLCYREQPHQDPAFLLMLVVFTHVLFYATLTLGDPRYRIPLEPLFIVFAMVASQRLLAAHRQALQSPSHPSPR